MNKKEQIKLPKIVTKQKRVSKAQPNAIRKCRITSVERLKMDIGEPNKAAITIDVVKEKTETLTKIIFEQDGRINKLEQRSKELGAQVGSLEQKYVMLSDLLDMLKTRVSELGSANVQPEPPGRFSEAYAQAMSRPPWAPLGPPPWATFTPPLTSPSFGPKVFARSPAGSLVELHNIKTGMEQCFNAVPMLECEIRNLMVQMDRVARDVEYYGGFNGRYKDIANHIKKSIGELRELQSATPTNDGNLDLFWLRRNINVIWDHIATYKFKPANFNMVIDNYIDRMEKHRALWTSRHVPYRHGMALYIAATGLDRHPGGGVFDSEFGVLDLEKWVIAVYPLHKEMLSSLE